MNWKRSWLIVSTAHSWAQVNILCGFQRHSILLCALFLKKGASFSSWGTEHLLEFFQNGLISFSRVVYVWAGPVLKQSCSTSLVLW